MDRRIEALIRVVDDALVSVGSSVVPAGNRSATREMLAEAAVAREWARRTGREARRGA
jgi:hypothetical protein